MATKDKKKHENQMSFIDEFEWKHGHGGKRTGAGCKKSAVEAKVMLVPEPLLASFKQQIEEYKRSIAAEK